MGIPKAEKKRRRSRTEMEVEMISTETIPPSSPTPTHHPLSFLDQMAPPIYSTLILYFPPPPPHCNPIPTLKSSLSKALSLFYPLSGRLCHPLSPDIHIDCTPPCGLTFVEAQTPNLFSDVIAESPLEDLVSLLPCHPFSVRSDSVACVQATHFGCGAIALAVCAAHRVVDAASLASFILTWSRISRGDLPSSSPTFDSHAIFPPQDMTCLDSDCTPKQNPAEPLVTHVFVFEPQTIKSLKASCMVLGIVPTTVEAVSILIWRSISKDGQPSGLAHVINIRQALEPPLPEGSFGNVVLGTFAEDRSGSGGNEEMVRAAIRSVDKEYVKKVRGRPMGLVESMARMMELWRDEGTAFVGLTSWYRFPIYGNDLGWGRPVWASPGGACMPGVVKLMPTRDTGGVEMWVTLPRQDMDLFERCPQISAYCSRRF